MSSHAVAVLGLATLLTLTSGLAATEAGISLEEMQRRFVTAPLAPSATLLRQCVRVCWQAPQRVVAARSERRIVFYRLYRVGSDGRTVLVGETRGHCLTDRGRGARAWAHAVAGVNAAGEEGELSEWLPAR